MSTPPSLHDARECIDEIDRKIVELLARRYALVDEVCETKADTGQSVRDPDREDELLDHVAAVAEEHDLSPDVARRIYDEVLAQSVRRQRRRREDAPDPSGPSVRDEPAVCE